MHRSSRLSARTLLAACAVLGGLGAPAARGATYTWSPAATSNAWSYSPNWISGQAPPASGLATSDIVYNTSLATSPNLSGGYNVNRLTFDPGSNGYVFSAGSLTLGAGGITQNSAAAQTFQIPVSLGANSTWSLGAGAPGALAFSSGLALGSNALTLNVAGKANLGGAISGTGSLSKAGAGTLALTGASTFTGSLATGEGTLEIGDGASLTPGSVSVDSTTSAALSQTGGTLTNVSTVAVGTNLPGTGTYALSGGTLSANTVLFVGYSGTGRFVQTGGTLLAPYVQVGSNNSGNVAGGSGSYQLVAGAASAPIMLAIGIDSAGTFTQTGGALLAGSVGIGGGSAGISGTYHLDGGMLTTSEVVGGAGISTLNFNGGTLRASTANPAFVRLLTAARVRRGGAVIDTNNFGVVIAQPLLHSVLPGDPATDGGLTKVGAGTLTLTGANTYTGDTTIKAGTLAVANDTFLGAGKIVTILPGGALAYSAAAVSTGRTFNLSAATLAPASGGTLTYLDGAAVNGGALGAGNHAFAGTVTLDGVRTAAGAVLSQSGDTLSLSNVTFGGNTTFTQAATGTLISTGGLTAHPPSTLTISGICHVAGAYLSGAVTITGTGRLNESGAATPLYLDGSRGVTVQSGGRLAAASGSTIELGGLLTNNGQQTGVLNVNLGGVVRGNGSFGTVNLLASSTFSAAGSAGALSVASGALVSVDGSGRTLTVAGQFVNNGTMRFTNGARLQVNSPANQVVNTGVIDVISGQLSLPAGFVNNGIVIDSSVVRVKEVSRAGGSVAVKIDGYPGHTYRLQRSASLSGSTFADVAGVDPQSNPATAPSVVTLSFTDTNPAAGEGFYRVVVDA